MTGLRRALILATAERYVVTLVNALSLPIMARLLSPSEFGISVMAAAALAVIEALREFGTTAYITQERELTREKLRTAFTIHAALTAILGGAVLAAVPLLEAYFAEPGVGRYVHVLLLAFAVGPLFMPTLAQLRREMAFGRIAALNITTTVLNVATAVTLAALGLSYMSLAYAQLASALAGVAIGLYLKPDLGVYRPTLRAWRSVVGYGRYDTLTEVVLKLWDSLPPALLGRLYGAELVGHFHRAGMLATLPERLVLSGLTNVLLPSMAAGVRQGRDTRADFLRLLAVVSAVHWSTMIVLALMAYPVVRVLLGGQWGDAVPLLQILAVAMLFRTPAGLSYVMLVAMGGVRTACATEVIFVAVAAVIFTAAAVHSVAWAALSMLAILPIRSLLAFRYVSLHTGITWRDIGAALRPSLAVAAAAAAGPLAVIAAGGSLDLSIPSALAAGVLSAAGFWLGIEATGHPLHSELRHLASRLAHHWSDVLRRRGPGGASATAAGPGGVPAAAHAGHEAPPAPRS